MGDISKVVSPAGSQSPVSLVHSGEGEPLDATGEVDGVITITGQFISGEVEEDKYAGYSLDGKIPFVVPKNEKIVSYCVKLGNLELCARVTKEAEPPSLMDFSIEPQIPYLRKGVEALLFGPHDVQEEKKPACFCEELNKLFEPKTPQELFPPFSIEINVFE